MTDKNGNVISRRDFMPFGEELTAGVGARDVNQKYSSSGIDNIRQRFTRYEKDIETDLDFAEARMYKNRHGRFTSPDPLLASASLDNPQTFNRYVYVGNNPVNLTDPSGLSWCRKKNSADTRFAGQGVACDSDEDNIDTTTGELTRGADYWAKLGGAIGDVVVFNSNGTIRVLDPANQQDAVQIAEHFGTTTYGSQDPVEMTGDSTLGTTISEDLLPLPCPEGETCNSSMTPPPRLDVGASAEAKQAALDRASLILTICGFVLDFCDTASIGVDTLNGDLEGAGLSTAAQIPLAGIPIGATKILKKAKRIADVLNGNSKASTKAQHGYEIFEAGKRDNVVKTGVSGDKIRKDGKSYRAEKQKRKWNREEGEGKYDTEIVKKIPAGEGVK